MRTAVTGGAGFIGSTLVDRLRQDGHQVLVIDDLSRGRVSNLDAALATADVDLEVLDIRDDKIGPLFQTFAPEVVFHLAGQIDVRYSVADPIHDADANILGTVKIGSAAIAAHARKIVFMSSGGSIYGSPEHLPVSEQAPVNPLSPYACGKVSASRDIRWSLPRLRPNSRPCTAGFGAHAADTLRPDHPRRYGRGAKCGDRRAAGNCLDTVRK